MAGQMPSSPRCQPSTSNSPVPVKPSSSQTKTKARKQWTLHDGPNGSLQRLRNQLAEDGCAESQVILAKQLLNDDQSSGELEVDAAARAENARIAVYWLMKASEQGNQEATELLHQCYSSCRGINEHNHIDVTACINMSLNEKLCRKAARDIFISLSNGEEFITTNQLKRRMLYGSLNANNISSSTGTEDQRTLQQYNNNNHDEDESTMNQQHQQQIDWSSTMHQSTNTNRKVTEENLIDAAVQYSNGVLPDINQSLSLILNNNTDNDQSTTIPFIYNTIIHPINTIQLLIYYIIHYISFIYNKYMLNININNVNNIIILYIIYYIYYNDINIFIYLLYYITLIILILQTLNIINIKCYQLYEYRVWGRLFILNVDTNNTIEYQYLYKHLLQSYIIYMITYCIHYMISSCMLDINIYNIMLISCISLIMTTFTCYMFTLYNNTNIYIKLLIISNICINVLYKYVNIQDEYYMILFILINIIQYILISILDEGSILKSLLPHCVTLSWLYMFISYVQDVPNDVSIYYMLYITYTTCTVCLFILPITIITTILLPPIYMIINTTTYTICMIILFVGCMITLYYIYKYKYRYFYRCLYVIQICCTIVSILIVYNMYKTTYNTPDAEDDVMIMDNDLVTSSYKQYISDCAVQTPRNTGSSGSTSLIEKQLKCIDEYDGVLVQWHAKTIEYIKIKLIKNTLKTLLNKFITNLYLKNYLLCLLGGGVRNRNGRCNINYLNSFVFEMKIKMDDTDGTGDGSTIWSRNNNKVHHNNNYVLLIIDDSRFMNVTKILNGVDKIWFRGTLVLNHVHSYLVPNVNVLEIGCVHCKHFDDDTVIYKVQMNTLYSYITFGLNYLYNCVEYVVHLLIY